MNRRQVAMFVWERALFLPYHWAGNDPMEGFDCSGLVVEGLAASGIIGRGKDYTAAALYGKFPIVVPAPWDARVPASSAGIRPGCLIFYDRDANHKIEHVEIVWQLHDTGGMADLFSIGASGGGSRTVTEADAREHNAYVKIRPATGWIAAVDPFFGEE